MRQVTTRLQHTIIRASAGTGKTYQLAIRYIALLMLQAQNGQMAPERLVALTFTRKGAAEFASRILGWLAAAAASQEQCALLEKDLHAIVQGDPAKGIKGLAPGVPLIINQALVRRVLAAVVDQLDRLCLGTIDSFMTRSVQTLAFELGLGGFEILDESAAELARRHLLAEAFRQAASSDLEAFYQTFKRATLKSSASLSKELDLFARNYHTLVCAIRSAEAWGGPAFWEGNPPAANNGQWKDHARKLAEQVAIMDFGHANIPKSLSGALQWISLRNCDTVPGELPSWLKDTGILCQLWRNWPTGDGVFDFSRKQRTIPASVMAPLHAVLAGWVDAETCALISKTQALFQILSSYEQTYDSYSRSKGRLAFSDLPLLLNAELNTAASEAITLLGFRWYQQFDHWLLDEFQDTSRTQWSVLQPWLDEAIQDNAGTKSVFVVGDVKQSIYGWRGGEPRLFQELVHQYQEAFCEQLMSESWRSRPAVLELANSVCCRDNAAFASPDTFHPESLARWEYDLHQPCEAKTGAPGYAAVLLADEEASAATAPGNLSQPGNDADDEGTDERTVARAQVILAALSRIKPLENGLTCAILTRKTQTALDIAQWLRASGVTKVMVEGDATLADQSPTLATLVDALRWLDTPANRLAEGHVLHSPMWSLLAHTPERGLPGPQQRSKSSGPGDDGTSIGMVWRHWRERIAQLGATAVTREWCAKLLARPLHDYSHYCLQQIDDLAHRVGASLGLAEWIVTLENFTVRETSAPGSIHLMTIHKAKGLGFDLVFLPDLDMGKHSPGRVLLRKDSRGVVLGCLLAPHKWLTAWEPRLGQWKTQQEAEEDLEALCVLYVALTRAKEATFVIMAKKKDGRSATRTSEWILGGVNSSCAAPVPSPWGPGELQWESGSRTFFEVSAPAEVAAVRPLTYAPSLQLLTPEPRRERKKPSEAGHDQPKPTFNNPITHAKPGQDFGTDVHEIFEQVEWWTAAQKLEGPEPALGLVTECLAVPAVKALFTRENPEDEALRELPLEFIEKDVWWSGIVDRLVLRKNADGSLRQAILIDFKTDKVKSAEALKERYAPQLDIYRRALRSALNQVPELILISTHLKTIVRL